MQVKTLTQHKITFKVTLKRDMAKTYHTLKTKKKSEKLHKIHSKRGRHGQWDTDSNPHEDTLKEARSKDTVLKQERHENKEIRSTNTALKQERHKTSLKRDTVKRYRAQKEGPLSHSRRKKKKPKKRRVQ